MWFVGVLPSFPRRLISKQPKQRDSSSPPSSGLARSRSLAPHNHSPIVKRLLGPPPYISPPSFSLIQISQPNRLPIQTTPSQYTHKIHTANCEYLPFRCPPQQKSMSPITIPLHPTIRCPLDHNNSERRLFWPALLRAILNDFRRFSGGPPTLVASTTAYHHLSSPSPVALADSFLKLDAPNGTQQHNF
jgi:hypothetical protein